MVLSSCSSGHKLSVPEGKSIPEGKEVPEIDSKVPPFQWLFKPFKLDDQDEQDFACLTYNEFYDDSSRAVAIHHKYIKEYSSMMKYSSGAMRYMRVMNPSSFRRSINPEAYEAWQGPPSMKLMKLAWFGLSYRPDRSRKLAQYILNFFVHVDHGLCGQDYYHTCQNCKDEARAKKIKPLQVDDILEDLDDQVEEENPPMDPDSDSDEDRYIFHILYIAKYDDDRKQWIISIERSHNHNNVSEDMIKFVPTADTYNCKPQTSPLFTFYTFPSKSAWHKHVKIMREQFNYILPQHYPNIHVESKRRAKIIKLRQQIDDLQHQLSDIV